MGLAENAYLAVTAIAQTFMMLSASFGLKNQRGTSILGYQTDSKAIGLVSQFVGPLGFIGTAMVLLAFVLQETESRLLYGILSYYHVVIGSNLAYYAFNHKAHFMVDDPSEGAVYHLIMGALAIALFIKHSPSRPTAPVKRKKI